MKLSELDPRWVRWEDQPYTGDMVPDAYDTGTEAGSEAWKAAGYPTERKTEMRERQIDVDTLAQAQGIAFTCPKCRNHAIAVAFTDRGVLPHHASHDADGRPTRWSVVGGSFADLSLSPSIDCTKGHNPNCWHGHITQGEIR